MAKEMFLLWFICSRFFHESLWIIICYLESAADSPIVAQIIINKNKRIVNNSQKFYINNNSIEDFKDILNVIIKLHYVYIWQILINFFWRTNLFFKSYNFSLSRFVKIHYFIVSFASNMTQFHYNDFPVL